MSHDARRPALPLPVVAALPRPPDLAERLAALGVQLGDEALEKLGTFLALLVAMNEKMNLTAIKEPDAVWSRHALDALSLVPELGDLAPGSTLLDVGSGGGVPGIPIAIARPDLRVTLLDATQKKIAFLDAVAQRLALGNVETIVGRAESVGLGPTFDIVTARAVAELSTLLGWTAPFVKRGGLLLLIKGERADAELAGAEKVLRRLHCTPDPVKVTPTGRIVAIRVGQARG